MIRDMKEKVCLMLEEFVEEHSCFPLYMDCLVQFKEDKEIMMVTIAFEQNGDVPESCQLPDHEIFFATSYENLGKLITDSEEDFTILDVEKIHGVSYDKETILDFLFGDISGDDMVDMFNTHFQTNRVCNELMELIDDEVLSQFIRENFDNEFETKELFDIAVECGFSSDECQDWMLEEWGLK